MSGEKCSGTVAFHPVMGRDLNSLWDSCCGVHATATIANITNDTGSNFMVLLLAATVLLSAVLLVTRVAIGAC